MESYIRSKNIEKLIKTGCIVNLKNHTGRKCECNIFNGRIYCYHHKCECINGRIYRLPHEGFTARNGLSRLNCRGHSKVTEDVSLKEASLELRVSVEMLRKRNKKELCLWAICDISVEIPRAN